MNARQWLYRAWNLQNEINQLKREKERELKDTKTTSSADNIVVSGSKDPHKPMDTIAEMTEQIDTFIKRRQKILMEVQEAIESLHDYRARTMLRERYIECKQWEAIYEEMNYSVRQCKRIEKKAMRDITVYLIETGKMSL